MRKGGFHLYQPRAWLSVEGADAKEFLQGQFTGDLRIKSAHSCTYGLWLDRKGRVQADGFVLETGAGAFRILSYECAARSLQERLEAFIIADDVEVSDRTDEVKGISFIGEQAVEWVEAAMGVAESESAGRACSGWVFSGRRSAGPQREWILPKDGVAEVEQRLRREGFDPWDADGMERERLRSRIPSVPREIGPADLPQEGGLERDAVSFTKGCYLGQEVMARLRAMGRLRRGLAAVRMNGVFPVPHRLFEGDREVGELRSCIPGEGGSAIGMAMLRRDRVGKGLSFEPSGPVRVEVLGDDE